MTDITKENVLAALKEWEDYPAMFADLPETQKSVFLERQGYSTFRALLAHIVAWWEEGFASIDDTLAGRERPRREYDFDVFNADAVERFKDWPETEFMSHYEIMRRKLLELVSGLGEEQLQIKRVRNWLNGVVLEHIEEHAIRRENAL